MKQLGVSGEAQAEGADKGFWTTIGAVWPHQDGKGFNVKLDYLPLNRAEIKGARNAERLSPTGC